MTHPLPTDPLRLGRAVVDPRARQVLVQGRAVRVGSRAFDVLLLLAERDRVVSKDELLQSVWPGLVVEENNLQVQVAALRRALGPEAIVTASGRGYRLALPVQPLEGDGAPPAAAMHGGHGGRGRRGRRGCGAAARAGATPRCASAAGWRYAGRPRPPRRLRAARCRAGSWSGSKPRRCATSS